jgi:hypothetical protein
MHRLQEIHDWCRANGEAMSLHLTKGGKYILIVGPGVLTKEPKMHDTLGDAVAVANSNITGEIIPRKRGRPKGSRNKSKEVPNDPIL